MVTDASQACSRDLAYLPEFLMRNDTGAANNRQHRGESAMATALEQANREAASAENDAQCVQALDRYLSSWRKGHLWVESANKAPEQDASATVALKPKVPLASVRWLSKSTVHMTFPSFGPEAERPIHDLFHKNQKRLQRTPNWIIDVRNNDGGSDWIYHPIIEAVIGNATLEVGAEFLATPANIEGLTRVCQRMAPGDSTCIKWTSALIDAMRAVPPGSYVLEPEIQSAVTRYDAYQPKRKRPLRVAVLTDTDCVSSCEQFLLTMRQGWNVKLMGRRTYGALDYSNLVPHTLPSGQRVLWHAISRSMRLPHLPVDAVGVLPDVFLAQPANERERAREVDFVHALLEGRAMDPLQTVDSKHQSKEQTLN